MSEVVTTWSKWLNNSRFAGSSEEEKQQMNSLLFEIRDTILDRANLKLNDVLLDVGTGTGLLAFGAYERLKGAGKVIASDAFLDCVEECYKIAESYGIENEIIFLQTDAADTKLPDSSVDVIVTRSVLVHILDKHKTINEFFRILKHGGRISSYEAVMNKNTKFYELINPDNFSNYEKLKEVEDKIISNESDPLLNFNESTLKENLKNAGFNNIDIIPAEPFSKIDFSKDIVDDWFNSVLSVGQPTIKEKYLRYLSENEVNEFIENLKTEFSEKIVTINLPKVYISAEKY
ncbi:MAG: class I SAM-dependent methyltransferase [bacterium]